jgi:paraquat-inducible protein A
VIARAAQAGLLLCRACGQLNRPCTLGVAREGEVAPDHMACSRCGSSLYGRKPASLARSWAFLTAASILYIPANLLPVMRSGSLFGSSSDTIMSGVRYLWQAGDWLIAAVIFIASIVFPGAKLAALWVLLATAGQRSLWKLRPRTRIYRTLEVIGRWSMTDIFVAGVVTALVQFKTIGIVTPGPGALAFAAVVLLTMFASMSFDPRLMWDPVEDAHD